MFPPEDFESAEPVIPGEWSAHLVFFLKKRFVLFVNDETLLTIMLAYNPKETLAERFRKALFRELVMLGVFSEAAEEESLKFRVFVPEKNTSRTMAGYMKQKAFEYKFLFGMRLVKDGTFEIEQVQAGINKSPNPKRKQVFPDAYVRKLFGMDDKNERRARAMRCLRQGLDRVKKGEYEDAIRFFGECIEADPGSASVYVHRGNVYAGLGRFDWAVRDFDRAAAIEPECAGIFRARGLALMKREDYKEAVSDYSEALRLEPDSASVYAARAVCSLKLGNARKAIKDLSRAVELEPNEAEFYAERAMVYSHMDEKEKAEADFSRAIELEPGNWRHHSGRGILRLGFGEYEKAALDFSSSIKLAPENPAAYFLRAKAYSGAGRRGGAIRDLEKCLELEPRGGFSDAAKDMLDDV